MKLCLITNYGSRDYVNEKLIHDQLLVTLGISSKDCHDFSNINSAYTINKQYDFALIVLDYKITSIEQYNKFLSEVKIPKIFIIECIAEKHKEVFNSLSDNSTSLFTSLSKVHQNLLYSEHSDGFIFYSELDKNLFDEFYNVDKSIARTVIPPSLGNKKDIKVNLKNIKPNTNILFNGCPSLSNGISNLDQVLQVLNNYTADIYGTHGREDVANENIVNHITSSNSNIKFLGKLKNLKKGFKLYHIFFNATIYDSFNYLAFLSLLNGTVPILSSNTGTSSYFKSYPFIAEHSIESLKYTLELINQTPLNYLQDILKDTANHMLELNDKTSKEKYLNFLNEL